MKKLLIVLFSIILILGGIFLWKGGHHAIFLENVMEEWLDADEADQSLTIQVQIPGFVTDSATGRVDPRVQQFSLIADSFWTEYADRRIFGLTAQGMTAYTDGENLYMDTGRAYTLPNLRELKQSAGQLALGLILHGRVTKDGGVYQIAMKTDELELNAFVTADKSLHDIHVQASLADGTAVQASVTARSVSSHAIPNAVSDAMVLSRIQQPTALEDPIAVLLPAMEALLPMEGDLTLGIACGILELEETVKLRVDQTKAEVERKGVAVSLKLPVEPADLEPLGAVLLLLRNGDYLANERGATVTLTLPPEETAALCAALIPQTEDLGLSFEESIATLTIADGKVETVTLDAGGSVPLVVTTIPLTFHAVLNIP